MLACRAAVGGYPRKVGQVPALVARVVIGGLVSALGNAGVGGPLAGLAVSVALLASGSL